ncbi:hypothetical protein DMH17_12910 [Raoultella planticola]|nr:hypothetical protein [Raoultella planticola]
MGDILFSSNFDENFFPNGADSYRDADSAVILNGWDGTDRMDVTLNNGSKWVGAAMSMHSRFRWRWRFMTALLWY